MKYDASKVLPDVKFRYLRDSLGDQGAIITVRRFIPEHKDGLTALFADINQRSDEPSRDEMIEMVLVGLEFAAEEEQPDTQFVELSELVLFGAPHTEG